METARWTAKNKKKQQLQRKTLRFIAGDDTNHVLQSKQNDRQKKTQFSFQAGPFRTNNEYEMMDIVDLQFISSKAANMGKLIRFSDDFMVEFYTGISS